MVPGKERVSEIGKAFLKDYPWDDQMEPWKERELEIMKAFLKDLMWVERQKEQLSEL